MKLFYHLFGFLLLDMVALISVGEYLSFQAEVALFEKDMAANAIQIGRSISGIIENTWREHGQERAVELIHDAGKSGSLGIRWVWLDSLLAGPEHRDTEPELREELQEGKTVSLKLKNEHGEPLRFTYIPVDVGTAEKGALELSQSLVPLDHFTDRMILRALIVTVSLVLLYGLILYFFINRQIRVPLLRLTEQAKSIGQGDLSVDHEISGDDELAVLARTMNNMCSSLNIAKEKIKFEYNARLKTIEQLRHTERLSTFGLISAGIAHEIGTPLNVVDGRAKMIISEELSAEEIRECAAIIKNQAERMTVIIRQLLDFTRRPEQHIAKENIVLIIKQIFQLLHPMAVRQRVYFTLNRAEDADVMLYADGSQIQQVLINLLMNSIQAMPEGGTVSVNLTNEMLAPAQFAEQAPRMHLKIHIVDEGEGICQEDIEHIFTPFFTTKTLGTGTGLGLSIAHGIVEEHGGWIEVESDVRNGTSFSVYLPMRETDQ